MFKAGKRLGVIMEGLVGEYSWFVMVYGTGLRMDRTEADNAFGRHSGPHDSERRGDPSVQSIISMMIAPL